jgi:hypothetical protein
MGGAAGDDAQSMLQALIAHRVADEARFQSLEAGQAALEAGQAALEAGQAALREEVAHLNAEIAEIRDSTAEQIRRELMGVWGSIASLLECMLPASQLSIVHAAAEQQINKRPASSSCAPSTSHQAAPHPSSGPRPSSSHHHVPAFEGAREMRQ